MKFIIFSEYHCLPLPYYSYTTVRTAGYRVGDRALVTCDTGHRFPDGETSKFIECTEDKFWSPQLPTCLSRNAYYFIDILV